MIAHRLDGRRESERILDRLKQRVARHRRPITLATVLVGSRYDSALYVKLKRKAAARVGIQTEYHHLATSTSQAVLHRLLRSLNRRRNINGILLQLPLPKHLKADAAITALGPKKDVDGFHSENTATLPPPVGAVLRLAALGHPKPGSLVGVVAQPSVFTERILREFERRGFPTVVIEPRGSIRSVTTKIDILVTALGRGPQLHAHDIKRGAIVVDVGIRKHGHHTIGDMHHDVWSKAGAISPVPGGVGPLTIAQVLWNTYQLAKRHG